MKTRLFFLSLALAACAKEPPKVDEALRQDLSLASQAYAPQQFVSPLEAGYSPAYGQPNRTGYQQTAARAPMIRRQPVRRAASSGSGDGGEGEGGGAVKNTKRDAAIGAAAGAVLGAVTASKKDRVKNAVLGAAAGAILGGVIGNNVDLTRKP